MVKENRSFEARPEQKGSGLDSNSRNYTIPLKGYWDGGREKRKLASPLASEFMEKCPSASEQGTE